MSDIHALSGAYAVDALDEHERELFERHLTGCADCHAEVLSLREAAATLAETSAGSPPAALRESVLSAISTVRPLPPVSTPSAPRSRRRLPALVAAAAAVVALLGSAVLVTQPWDDETSQTQVSAADVVNAPDARQVQRRFDGATATVYHSASLGRAAVVFDDLPPAPPGRVYELWLQQDGVMVPAGLVDGHGDQEILLTGDATAATAAGISLEPDGGSEEPTLPAKAILPFEQAA